MQLIGFGEFRHISGTTEYYARFRRSNGTTFDMPLTEEQLGQLLIQVQSSPAAKVAEKAAEAPKPTAVRAQPSGNLLDDEIEEDEAPLRMAVSIGDDE